MRFAKARISILALIALFLSSSARADRPNTHTGPSQPQTQTLNTTQPSISAGGGASSVPLPEFDAERVQKITQEMLQKYRTARPKNWIELQQAEGSVMINATIPSKLPKFDPQKVGPAVEQLAASIASQNPGSWQELGQILNRFTGVIPATVMENMIAFRVLQRQASDKNEDKLAKNDPARGKSDSGSPATDEKAVPAGIDRLNPEARKAVEKELDSNIGKFTGFMSPPSPQFPNFVNLPPTVTGSSSLPEASAGNRNGTGSAGTNNPSNNNSFTSVRESTTFPQSAPPMIPVLSQNSPSFPSVPTESGGTAAVPPSGSDDNKIALPVADTTNQPPQLSPIAKSAAVDGLMNAIVAQLPKGPATASPFALQGKTPLLGERLPTAAEKDKLRKYGVRLGQTGPSGSENFGVAGEGDGDWPAAGPTPTAGGWMGSAMDWLLASLGLKDSEGAEDEGKGLSDSEPYVRTAGEFGDIAGSLSAPFAPKTRNRVIASVAQKTGLSVGSASRLYYGALYAAWGGTAGLLAFAFGRLRRRKNKL